MSCPIAMKRNFERKFGPDFLDTVPTQPGVYRFLDEDGEVLYVGKAKNLRKRLMQYRDARRTRSHRKMRRIVRSADRITFELTESEGAALLLEDALIKRLQPPLNVAGAYSFLYPVIGVQRCQRHLHLAYSSQEEALARSGFRRFGCFRNRNVTRAAFDALVQIFSWLGHVEGAPESLPYTTWRRFRQIPTHFDSPLNTLLSGDSDAFLQEVILGLVDKPAARRDAAEVQASIHALKAFFDTEGARLAQLRTQLGAPYVPQEERDRLLIELHLDEDELED